MFSKFTTWLFVPLHYPVSLSFLLSILIDSFVFPNYLQRIHDPQILDDFFSRRGIPSSLAALFPA